MGLEVSASQAIALKVTVRVTACVSLVGVFFILLTYLLGRGFDKPINRLIFFASWGNLGLHVVGLIARDGINAGDKSSLCQFQAWLCQMFLGVDALWALCMALNVYLALFHKWSAARMRALEWKYFIGCYGLSFIPAFTYLFVETKHRGKVYGPALLWCWIRPEWVVLRMATLYAVIWVAILSALIIYSLAFRKVWRSRDELRGIFNPFNEDPFAGVIVTEIEITHQSRPLPTTNMQKSQKSAIPDSAELSPSLSAPSMDRQNSHVDEPSAMYSVNVEAGENMAQRTPSIPYANRLPSFAFPSTTPLNAFGGVRSWTRNAALHETNPEAWLYARAAFLFYCALLISWLPASINRVYSLARPDSLIFGLNYTETLLLSLEGFWIALIYIITSQTACRNLWRSIIGKPELPRKNGGTYGTDSHWNSHIHHGRKRSAFSGAGMPISEAGEAVAGVTYRGKSEQFPLPPPPSTINTVVIGAKVLGRKVKAAATINTTLSDESHADKSGIGSRFDYSVGRKISSAGSRPPSPMDKRLVATDATGAPDFGLASKQISTTSTSSDFAGAEKAINDLHNHYYHHNHYRSGDADPEAGTRTSTSNSSSSTLEHAAPVQGRGPV